MKLRAGYVSNSSSSSYWVDSTCFMGVNYNAEGYKGIDYQRYKALNLGFDYETFVFDEGDNVITGLSVTEMGEDETKAQFRKRVFEILQSCGYTGKESDVDWQLPEYSGECG